MEIPMSERCIHIINEQSLKCTKCGSPFDLAKNDPRPFSVVKGEHKSQKYDMNEEIDYPKEKEKRLY